MNTLIRRFNESGIEQFRNVLHQIKDGVIDEVPPELLTSSSSSEIVHSEIEVDKKLFHSKNEIVRYLFDKISKVQGSNLLYDAGLWSWLAAFYFDSICPIRSDKSRKVGEDSRYILNAEEWNKYYRHLLASPTRLHKELRQLSKIYLTGTPDKPGDLFEQLASRQEIASCKSVIEAATLLYWDNQKETIKRGARNKEGGGVLRRFVQSTIPQFQMTYDLNAMNGPDLIKLLPSEYNTWLTSN